MTPARAPSAASSQPAYRPALSASVEPVPPPPGRWKILLFLIVTLAAGALAWLARRNVAAPKPAPVVVRTATVREGPVEAVIRLTGVTAAQDSVALTVPILYGSRTFGGHGHGVFSLILQTLAQPGARVRKDDIVASFDRQYMENRLDDHRALLDQHKAYMRMLVAQFEVRRKVQEQRVRGARGATDKAALDLKTAPVRSAIQTERYRLQLEESRARHESLVDQWRFFENSERSAIRRLDLDIKEQTLGLQRAERNLDRMTVRAPISGIFVVQSVHRGGEMGEIQAGDQLYPGHIFAQVVNQDSMVVNVQANQADAERLRFGQRAMVRFDAYPDIELPARVVSIGVFATGYGFRQNYVKQIPVRLKLERMDPRVIPNSTVSADVILESQERAVVVPIESLFQDRPGAGAYVWVRGAAEWEKREVAIGLRDNIVAAVRQGLHPGEVVAVEPPSSN